MYRRLVRLRLRWYLRTSGQLVLRHWQWFMLACLLVPGPPLLAQIMLAASLLQAAVSFGHGVAPHFLLFVGIELTAVLWILPQRHALSGGPFSSYADTMPLPRGVRFAVEATLVLIADGLIVLPAGIATGHLLNPPHATYGVCSLWALLGCAAAAQYAALRRRRIGMLGVLLGDGALAIGLGAPMPGARWLLLLTAIGSAAVGILATNRVTGPRESSRLAAGRRTMAAALRPLSRRAPSLLIQLHAIMGQRVVAIFRLGAALLLALGADRLIALFQFDARTLPTAILAMAAICLVLAGLYRTLADAHRAMAAYLASLPLRPHHWPARDTLFVLSLGAVPLVILLSPQLVRGFVSVFVLLALAAAYHLLLALLRWPVVRGGRAGLLYGLLLAAAWSGAAIAAVSR